jgi:HlyD family secretion protein
VGSRWGLFVFEQGRARLREVNVASRNGVDAWLNSPLAPDTQVVVYPDSKLQDGARVKGR